MGLTIACICNKIGQIGQYTLKALHLLNTNNSKGGMYASPVIYSSAASATTDSFPLVMITTLTPEYCLIQEAESIGQGIKAWLLIVQTF